MALSSVIPEILTSAERWRRWEQHGLDNDARFMRQVRSVGWSAVVVGAVLLLFFLIR
jgi:nicotinamide riboside transporter PnuC